MFDELEYKTIGTRKSVFCASAGLLTAVIINLLFGTLSLAFKFPDAVITGIIGLYVCAYFYGKIGGKIIYRSGTGNYKIWLVGILLAWSCVITMTVAGSSIYFFNELNLSSFSETFISYVFAPLFWITFFGFIPSSVLGLIWAKQMKREFRILD